jgi:alkylation response protein AidB-like acyl-CoA dehydrogenase
MNFDFTEEQYLLRDSLRSYLAENWTTARLRAAEARFDAGLWQGLCDLGVQTLMVPEEHGGAGLDLIDSVLSFESFGRALVPGPIVDTILASEVIARFADAGTKAELLPRIAAGEARIAFAHVERDGGYGSDGIALAVSHGPDGWRLDGRKILVPAAEAATDLAVSARLPDGRVGLFLCPAVQPGVMVARHTAIDPYAMACRVVFDGAHAVPLCENAPEAALSRLHEASTLAVAAQMVGIATAALDSAVAYAKQRSQFGQLIGSFQAIKHKCADMFVAAEYAANAVYHAAWAMAEDVAETPLAVSVAKAAAGDACRLVCNECLQIHGGVGFTAEFDVHLFMKRGKMLEYAFGDARWHRERVARLILPAAVQA